MKKLLVITLCLSSLFSCSTHKKKSQCELSSYAVALLDSTLKYYSTARIGLFHENYPSKDDDMVTYLAGEDTIRKNRVAYLWPTSGMFSAVNALLRASDDNRFKQMLDSMIIPGLECYWDSLRLPVCYQSYIAEAGYSDRFYDDNLWIGIDFLESYKLTQKSNYLSSAEKIWKFIESGRDSVLNDGIYWCEQKKLSKNTCSNAPAAVFALKLYEATNEKKYLEAGKELYHWTKVVCRILQIICTLIIFLWMVRSMKQSFSIIVGKCFKQLLFYISKLEKRNILPMLIIWQRLVMITFLRISKQKRIITLEL